MRISPGPDSRQGPWTARPTVFLCCHGATASCQPLTITMRTIFSTWALLLVSSVCAQTPLRPSFTCGGNLTEESGLVGSQGYPGVYPPNTKCVWRITVPIGRVVVLSFRFIDLESDNLCRYDYVDVYSGHTGGQRLGRFCGTARPGALVSTGNKMMLQMMSDANTAGSGFLAVYSAAHPHQRGELYCGGRLEKPTGSFKTPNWPEKDYPAGVTCSWHIVAPKHQIIEVRFEKFDVERDNYCRYDHVSIFNGPEINDARRIGKFCGDSPPSPVLSEGNQLVIQFLSDLSLTADGFIAHYTFRPKKYVSSTPPAVTTTQAPTTRPIPLKYSAALCQPKCKKRGSLETNYCSSNFVLTGTVITAAVRGGSVFATVSILNLYKEGGVAIQQAGKTMSTKIIILCRKCPLVRRGMSYLFMGQADEDGRGTIGPQHLVTAFKTRNQKDLSSLKTQHC